MRREEKKVPGGFGLRKRLSVAIRPLFVSALFLPPPAKFGSPSTCFDVSSRSPKPLRAFVQHLNKS